MSKFAFALKPKWLLGHVLLIVGVGIMISLAFWQLDRLSQRKSFNRELAARSELPVIDAASLISQDQTGAQSTDEFKFRNVFASGIYDSENEFLLRGRIGSAGIQGFGVLTPLVLNDGRAIIVERGWIPAAAGQDIQARPIPTYAATEQPARVEGVLWVQERRTALQASSAFDAASNTLGRIDLEEIQKKLPYQLIPYTILARNSEPQNPNATQPEFFKVPKLSEGPHLSYAFQWFSFSVIALIVWPLAIIKRSRSGSRNPVPLQESS